MSSLGADLSCCTSSSVVVKGGVNTSGKESVNVVLKPGFELITFKEIFLPLFFFKNLLSDFTSLLMSSFVISITLA